MKRVLILLSLLLAAASLYAVDFDFVIGQKTSASLEFTNTNNNFRPQFKFNVDADEDNGRLSVTLAEGSVRVALRDNPDNAIVLKPDEKACIADGRIVVVKTEAGDEIRWKDGIVDIGGLAFDELMYKLEMAFGVDIVIDRADLPEICFTDGRLRISDGIEYALNVLRNGSDFTWTKDYRTGTIHIR